MDNKNAWNIAPMIAIIKTINNGNKCTVVFPISNESIIKTSPYVIFYPIAPASAGAPAPIAGMSAGA